LALSFEFEYDAPEFSKFEATKIEIISQSFLLTKVRLVTKNWDSLLGSWVCGSSDEVAVTEPPSVFIGSIPVQLSPLHF
jgi:hypothetical protein